MLSLFSDLFLCCHGLHVPIKLQFLQEIRGCLHDTCMTFIPVQDKKVIPCLHKLLLLGREFYTAVKRNMKRTIHRNEFSYRNENLAPVQEPGGIM